jgi:hypothetical protein
MNMLNLLIFGGFARPNNRLSTRYLAGNISCGEMGGGW